MTVRAPWTVTGAPLLVFTTHDPDTGQAVNADALPTAQFRYSLAAHGSFGLALVENVDTGVYQVRHDPTDDNFEAQGSLQERFIVIVTAVVGGVTQKIAKLIESSPTVCGGNISTESGDTADHFHVSLTAVNYISVNAGLAAGDLVGSLLCTKNGEVRRITGFTRPGGLAKIQLDSALNGYANGLVFWIVTI